MKHAAWRRASRVGFLLGSVMWAGSCKTDASGGNTGPVTVATVAITPNQVSLVVGATRQLTAELRDAQGNLLTGRNVTWNSTNPNVASVSPTGLVTALAAGTARISASADGRSTDVPVDVTSPPIVTIVITAPAQTLFPGQTLQLTATARDAANNTLPGKTFVWATSNGNVMTVNQSGLVSGVAVGNANITAAAEGITGNLALNVTPAPTIQVAQITPATLVEGQAGTITGSGFSTTAAANTVSIDGINATVTQATATSLQFTVPAFNCLPRRNAPVQVSASGGTSNVVTHPISPASFVALTVGQQVIVSDPADRCLQFNATTASERYVVGVQSVSEVVSTLSPVTVTAGVPSGAITTPALPVVSPRVA
ncbi:MAG: Ig-like domain-containing protein, partial [Longimicrobiales bacterium]